MRGHVSRRTAALVAAFAGGGGILLAVAPAALADPGPGGGTSTPSPIVYTVTKQPLVLVGVSDLAGYQGGAAANTAGVNPNGAVATGGAHANQLPPLLLPTTHAQGASPDVTTPGVTGVASTLNRSGSGSGTPTPIVPGQYPGTVGFPGINGQQDTVADGYYLEPPDQGLCVGGAGGPNATQVEIINNALQAYSPSGQPESPIIPASVLFDVPADATLSDPRCYWDQNTRRWFFTEFVFGPTSTQYIAVSQTDDPLGAYTVFAFDTTDANAPPGYNCPCFGDFDQIGADLNGFYITTNEFNVAGNTFNGTDIWAMSKELLVDAADFEAPPPPVDRYAVTADQFGLPYHVSPSQTPPDGSYFPNTELFVESNSDANIDDHLLVYAMTNTSLLRLGGIPPLAASSLTTETYTYPTNAHQAPGSAPANTIDTDFNAIQEVTETHGILYAELDSGGTYNATLNAGIGPAQADWFILDPEQNNPLQVQLLNQGVVSNPTESFMYPDIAVGGDGDGYLIFSVSGTTNFPSPGYVAFDKYAGPQGPALLPTQGVDDENGFTCYPPYGVPGDPFNDCRWGDYSMGVAYDNRIFMAAEYIPPPGIPAPAPVNWGTYLWNASKR